MVMIVETSPQTSLTSELLPHISALAVRPRAGRCPPRLQLPPSLVSGMHLPNFPSFTGHGCAVPCTRCWGDNGKLDSLSSCGVGTAVGPPRSPPQRPSRPSLRLGAVP